MEVRIATATDLHDGRAIASRLRAEGIPCRLQSESLGPFVVSVGSMAAVEVFVPGPLEATARAVLESDHPSGIASGPGAPGAEPVSESEPSG